MTCLCKVLTISCYPKMGSKIHRLPKMASKMGMQKSCLPKMASKITSEQSNGEAITK